MRFDYDADLRKFVHREAKLLAGNGTGGYNLTLPCSKCGPITVHLGVKLPPDQVAKRLKNRGWTLGKNCVCPDHEKEPAMPKSDLMNETSLAPSGTAAPPPTDKARVARRETIMLLEDVFDVSTGRYREGEDDASVGRVTGLAKEAVAKLREEFYGPLKVPTELETLRENISKLRKELEMNGSALIRETQTKLDAMIGTVDDMASRVEAACRKFA